MIYTVPIVVAFMVIVNLWTIHVFHYDKKCAIAGRRRTPESELLFLAMIGGSAGALIARRWFRHKTRKEPFSTYLLLIVVIQIGLVIGWFLL